MSAVGLEQKRSEAVGPGSNLCRVRYFSDFTDIYSFTETNFHSFFPPLTQKFSGKQEGSLTNFFVSVLWNKTFFDNSVMPPPMHQNFRCQSFFETQKGSPTKFFAPVRQKNFDKTMMPPLLCIKNFDTRIFLKRRRIPLRNFWALWDKKIQRRIVISPSYAKTFSIPEIFWNIKGFLHKVFWHCETKNFDKIMMPSLVCIKIFETRIFLKHRGVLLRSFSVLCYKKYSTEHRDIPLFCIELFDTRNFLIYWRVLQEIFWHCETKKSHGKTWNPPFVIHKYFSIPENFWITEGTPYEVFRHCEIKKFQTKNRDIPLLSINFFFTRNFLKHRRFIYEMFRYCETTKFRRKMVILPLYP